MAEISVDITRLDEETLKVKWCRGSNSHKAYSVKLERIRKRSTKARDALQELVEAARETGCDRYPAVIRGIAEAGYELYKALFFGITQEDHDKADHVRAWVSQWVASGKDTVTFNVPSRLHIPWGLIYNDPNQPNIDAPLPHAVSPDNFWCMKYAAAAQYSDIPPDGLDTAWSPELFRVLFGAHQDTWDAAQANLDENERTSLFKLLSHPEQPMFALNELYKQWLSHKETQPHGLLSFYCHASGKELLIGAQTLSALTFEEKFARKQSASKAPTLVFLAGCQTAIGDIHEGFLECTSGPGYCGFVGTEVKVPDVFALRFLARFLDRFFVTGQTVGAVMQQLRKDHWPLSLAFSVCCTRDLRLSPVADASPLPVTPNLSFERVSSC